MNNLNKPVVYGKFIDEELWKPLYTYKSLQTMNFPPYRPKLKIDCDKKEKNIDLNI